MIPTPADVADYNAGIHNARRAYAEDPSHRWCARGCFNLARIGAYCSTYCADQPRPHRREEPMIQTPRPWPEDSWPTPEQYAAWLKALTDDELVEVAERHISNSQDATECFQANHEGAVGELNHLYRRLPAMLDQARAEGAAAVVRDVGRELPDRDWRGYSREYLAACLNMIRFALARHAPSEATERPPEPAHGDGKVTTPETGGQCLTDALSGRMVCQLRRGHAGNHEDWRAVTPERRA